MLRQMRSRNRVMLPPCPCGGICRCHIPHNNKTELRVLKGIIISCLVVLMYLIYYEIKHPNKHKEHIEVNGKMCEIGWHRDCATPLNCGHKCSNM